MARGKMVKKTTRSSAGVARGGFGGGVSATPKDKGNTRAQKKVSFSSVEEDSDASSDFTPVSVTVSSTPSEGRTPSSSTRLSSATSRQIGRRGTPYPTIYKLEKTGKRLNNKGQQKRRRSKPTRSVFSTCKQEKKRPQSTLTMQLKYTMDILPEKVEKLKNNKDMCHATRIQELEALDENLIKRISIVSGLDMKEGNEEIRNRQHEVLDEMTKSLQNLQALMGLKKLKLEEVRPVLRAAFNSRYVCCPVCAEEEKRRNKSK